MSPAHRRRWKQATEAAATRLQEAHFDEYQHYVIEELSIRVLPGEPVPLFGRGGQDMLTDAAS